VPWLFEVTHEAEMKSNKDKAKKQLSAGELREFLSQEACLLNQRATRT
jgi:hypothetical protein